MPALDSSRFKYYLTKALKANPNEVEGFEIGCHGTSTMIPMKRFDVEAVIHDQDAIIPCSALVEGEYGESGLCIGVLCQLGKGGIKRIVPLEMNDAEKALFAKSAEAVRKTNEALPC